jgi:tripartite-type tricarboxylate transporter receptor subunit TctC
MQQVNAGKLRALAVTSLQPSPQAPGVPTMASQGLPGYESVFRAGLFAPTGTPQAVIAQLNRETARLLQRAEIKEKLLGMGMESVGSTPDEFAAAIRSEVAIMGKVIKEAGIRDE